MNNRRAKILKAAAKLTEINHPDHPPWKYVYKRLKRNWSRKL